MGDFCRVLCEFDGQEHEVNKNENKSSSVGNLFYFCIFQVEIIKQHPSNPEIYRIQVLGYEHKEVKNRTLLKESLGETARKAQIEEVAAKSASTSMTSLLTHTHTFYQAFL